MRKTKKYLALFMSAAIVTGLTAGCGSPKQESAETTAVAEDTSGYEVTEENENQELVMNDQPESSYWFPDELLSWNPDEDKDLEFNKSVVPLAQRADRNVLTPVNDTQNKDTNIMAISIMNSSTSGNAPNGLNKIDCNTFSYWQYVDTLVYWGGSSGEGLIVPPSPDVTDAAHKNGVKIIGTVFFPQDAHGGKLEWMDDFLKKDDSGNFPMADKLIQVAELYGFDGWFINPETEGTDENPLNEEHALLMREFISSFKEKAPSLDIIYYDSMTIEGEMDWQNALTEKNIDFMTYEGTPVSDSMFLNFWWTDEEYIADELIKASRDMALESNVDPYDIYAGVDIQSEGYLTPIQWNLFESAKNSTFTSLGLYCPNWAYSSSSDMEDFMKKESAIWVNSLGDPSASINDAENTRWKGISTYAVERTAITSLPFITNFNTGNGYSFFVKGEQASRMDWNNRSLSDILPTYRFLLNQEGANSLKASFDVGNAYYGGNSLKLYGDMDANTISEITLYSADLPISEGTLFTTTAKADAPTKLEAVIDLEDGSQQVISADSLIEKDWTTVTFDLSLAAGKKIRRLSYQLSSDEAVNGYSFYFGNITITDEPSPQVSTVSNVTAEGIEFDEDAMYAGVRLSWLSDTPAAYYEVYRINENGSRSLLGVSNKTNFYINTLPRTDETNRSNFEVVPVTATLEAGTGATVTVEWPDNSLPKAGFTADKTLIAPGEAVTFESKCSVNTETVEWTFTGASEESSTEESPSVTYGEAGVYPVAIKAVNASGEAVSEVADYIVVSDSASAGLILLSGGKDTEATAYVNDNEAPEFAVDGDVTKKWCATGTPPHELTIDLGDVKTISAVDVFHAEAGGEGSDMNSKAYTISVSEDGVSFEPVANITRNTKGTTHDTFAPVSARYVKLSVIKPTQGSDSAARIYEVEVYGIDGTIE